MRVLFVGFRNSARSQMAQAFFERATTGHVASSAGLRPGKQIDPLVIEVMAEVGIDIRDRTPCALSPNIVSEADIVVRSIRPDHDDYEWPIGPRYVDWVLPLPADESEPTIEEVRRLRDDARGHAVALAHEIALAEVRRVATLLARTSLSFGFCGGWGLELFAATHKAAMARFHSDIDVAVLRSDLPGWASELSGTFRIARDGELRDADRGTVAVTDAHEIHLSLDGLVIELLVNDIAGDEWVYRRDGRVRRLLSRAFIVEDLPLLAPEIVLLFKAKLPRSKDYADFEAILPLLDTERRSWLLGALDVAHPNHQWAPRLRS